LSKAHWWPFEHDSYTEILGENASLGSLGRSFRVAAVTRNQANERREVYFGGHVQGVGFRFSTQQIAREFDITGFVENLPDGRVHLVVEGTRPEIDAFLKRVREGLSQYIHSTQGNSGPANGEFGGFSIRH